MLNPKQRYIRIGWGILFLSVFPITWMYRYYYKTFPFSGCFFKTIIGKPCPFCGLTRSISHAIHGEFQKAFVFHPLWWVAVLFIIVAIIIVLYEGITGDDLFSMKLKLRKELFWVYLLFVLIAIINRWSSTNI